MEPADRSASWVTSSAKLARSGGSANVVSLEGLRKALGERWPKLREAAAEKLDQLLRQRLEPTDFFLVLDDMNRLVLMPHASAEEGAIACLRVAYDLHTGLAGPCHLDHLAVAPAVAVADNIIEVVNYDHAELLALAGRAGLRLAQPGAADSANLVDQSLDGGGSVEARFMPVWDAEVQVIRGYRCMPKDGWHLYGPEASAQRLQAVTHVTLALMEQGAHELVTRIRRGERFLLFLPASYEILANPVARMQFLAGARAMPAELRPYIAYAIKDLPVGIPQSRIAEVVTILRAFCGAVFGCTPRSVAPVLASFRSAGVKALGVSVLGMTPEQIDTEIAALMTETRRSGVLSFAYNVDTSEALRTCLARGVNWLCGTAIAPAVAEAGPLRSLKRDALLKRSEAAA